MNFSFYNLLLVAIGSAGATLSLTLDFLRGTALNFGINQLAGFVIGSIVAVTGLIRLIRIRSRFFDTLLFGLYFAGILFMGFRPVQSFYRGRDRLLDLGGYSNFDFTLNIIGFIPLGYLMMLFFAALDRTLKKTTLTALVFVSCLAVSFFIELFQTVIPGRNSALLDVVANGIGALIGIVYYRLAFRNEVRLKD